MTNENSNDDIMLSESYYKPYDSTQEPIFPPELRLSSNKLNKQALVFQGKNMSWLRPVTLDDLLTLKDKHQGLNCFLT